MLAGREREANIFQSEQCRKARRLKFSVGDKSAIGFVNWGGEKSRGEKIHILMLVDSSFADEHQGFAE